MSRALAAYTAGTISVANGATAVTGVGTSWVQTINNVASYAVLPGDMLQIGTGRPIIIAAVDPSGTALTLAEPWPNTTASGSAYRIYRYQADLSVTNLMWLAGLRRGLTDVGAIQTLASASTVDLGSVSGWSVLITGTTTITSFGTGENLFKQVRFGGALTLTHNATSLILPGAANITTAAGDVGLLRSDASGNWRMLAFQRAASPPYSGPFSRVIGNDNFGLGPNVMPAITTGFWNIAFGSSALSSTTTGSNNTALGVLALQTNTSGGGNVAIGTQSLRYNTVGTDIIAIGTTTLINNTTGYWNIGVGSQALRDNTTGLANIAAGVLSLSANTNGSNNVAIGTSALQGNTTGANNTAIGNSALVSGNTTNSTGIGYGAAVTGNNQVQLGDSATTTYVFGTVQNRSDARDKADVRDTVLGLPFLMTLRPVDYRWDMREDYRPSRPERPKELSEPLPVDATDEQKAAREAIETAYRADVAAWAESARLANITHDGSKKRRRYHTGLIAQEVAAAVTAAGFDQRGWGAIQDHGVSGGDAVMTLGYDQFVPVLIKAVQELSAQNAALEARLAALEAS